MSLFKQLQVRCPLRLDNPNGPILAAHAGVCLGPTAPPQLSLCFRQHPVFVPAATAIGRGVHNRRGGKRRSSDKLSSGADYMAFYLGEHLGPLRH